MQFNKLNKRLGWAIFAIATLVYFMTLERTVSLWDCGEYIATSYKLEVGHPPGAPLFMMAGRLFSAFFGDTNAALMINVMSALCSSFTILFLFWTITMIGRKFAYHLNSTQKKGLSEKDKEAVLDGDNITPDERDNNLSASEKWAIFGSAVVGSLAYTFSDSFWFSAVEAEVYAMSSFFTALVVWAIFKWERVAHQPRADRWLVFIAFMIGLSIGVHLLNLLAIPALAYMYYFKKFKNTNAKGFIVTGIVAVAGLLLIQEGIIPGTIQIAANLEVFFTNSFGLPFNSGAIIFGIVLVSLLTIGLLWSQRKGKVNLNTALLSLVMLYIGYTCFAMIPIRSNADLPIDENNPENAVALNSYLLREQYGDWPLLHGPYFNTPPNQESENDDRTDVHIRAWVVVKDGDDIEGFRNEDDAKAFAERVGGSVERKYYMTENRAKSKRTYDDEYSTYFPRMHSMKAEHIDQYKQWSGYTGGPNSGDEESPLAGDSYTAQYLMSQPQAFGIQSQQQARGVMQMNRKEQYNFLMSLQNPNAADLAQRLTKDGINKPSMGQNLTFFFNYQVMHMYWRYFMWNFSGRQNDEQNWDGNILDGNWLSGVPFIDNERLGDQSKLPDHMKENNAYNKYFMLPLILGLIGFFFQLLRAPKDWFIVFLLFLLTGLAIVIYLNQKPIEPRERDYAYAGSTYAFAIWIGLGVYALYRMAKDLNWKKYGLILGYAMGLGVLIYLVEMTQGKHHVFSYSIFYITLVSGALMSLVKLAPKVIKKGHSMALTAGALCMVVPAVMGIQGWNDHDRSGRATARELAKNYLKSAEEQGIMFTNGDNDTFPLWYAQEVEGFRTDVRTVNLSLLNTSWYVEQMTRRAYDSDPLPISFTYEGYRDGNGRDAVCTPEGLDNLVFNWKMNEGSWGPVPQRLLDMQEKVKETREKRMDIREVLKFINMDEGYDNYIWSSPAEMEHDRRMYVIPTDKFMLPIEDKDAIVENGIVSEDMRDNIVDRMEWGAGGSFIYRAQLTILDIVAHHNWERPIYFAATGGQSAYAGLTNYFFLEGLIFQIKPLTTGPKSRYMREKIDTDRMYQLVMEEFDWGGLNKPGINVDYYTRRPVVNFRRYYLALSDALLQEGETTRAKDVLDKLMAEFPSSAVPLDVNATYIMDAYLKTARSLEENGESQLADECRNAANAIGEDYLIMQQQNIEYYTSMRPDLFLDATVMAQTEQTNNMLHSTVETLAEDSINVDMINRYQEAANASEEKIYTKLDGLYAYMNEEDLESEERLEIEQKMAQQFFPMFENKLLSLAEIYVEFRMSMNEQGSFLQQLSAMDDPKAKQLYNEVSKLKTHTVTNAFVARLVQKYYYKAQNQEQPDQRAMIMDAMARDLWPEVYRAIFPQ